MRYLIAIFEKVSIRLYTLELGISSSWRPWMVGLCIVPHMCGVMIMSGNDSHLIWVSIGCSIAYLLRYLLDASTGKRSLQYVNSKICILSFGLGEKKGMTMGRAPSTHSMSGLSLVGTYLWVGNMCMATTMRVRCCLDCDQGFSNIY